MGRYEAHAVIGAGYGDEGKGLAVDAIARRLGDAVVVRSNGGAQAGHTVTTADGRRHVFHHFGSGALAGAPTHLSRHFVCHPMMFLEERVKLAVLGAELSTGVDPRSLVTTPFDVMVNQAVEMARGDGRHGSCGLGFGETIERNLHPEFSLDAGGLRGNGMKARLQAIRDRWLPRRLAKLGVAAIPEGLLDILADHRVIDVFMADCDAFLDAVHLKSDAGLAKYGTVLFEGAQGLMLDQDAGAFPFVTRSNTGLKNMLAIAAEAGIETIDATYMTRAYVTRHGAGPMAAETTGPDGFSVVDATNVPNPWQGTIRYGNLDTSVLAVAISTDMQHAAGGDVSINAGFAVTCLDQATGPVPLAMADRLAHIPPTELPDVLASWLAIPCRAVSRGPTCSTFEFMQTDMPVSVAA